MSLIPGPLSPVVAGFGITPLSGPQGTQMAAPSESLYRLFSSRAAETRSPAFVSALRMTLLARQACLSRKPVGELLGVAAQTLATTTQEEMDLVPPSDHILVAAGIHAVAQMAAGLERDSSLTTSLVMAAANLASFDDESPVMGRDVSLFLQDRLLSWVLFSRAGSLAPATLTKKQEEALGVLLARVGIASGSLNWSLPNAMGALYLFLGEIPPATMQRSSLLAPNRYFEIARSWRPEPMGDLEYFLARDLDRTRSLDPKRTRQFLGTRPSYQVPSRQTASLTGYLEIALQKPN